MFDNLSGRLAAWFHINITRCTTELVKTVYSDPEQSGELGNIQPPSSGACGAPCGALTACLRAVANCILKPLTTSPACCAGWIITGIESSSSSGVPWVAGLQLAHSHLSFNLHKKVSIAVRSHCRGRQWGSLRSIIFFANLWVTAWCSHSLCTTLRCSK
jgi:hypothetical protein